MQKYTVIVSICELQKPLQNSHIARNVKTRFCASLILSCFVFFLACWRTPDVFWTYFTLHNQLNIHCHRDISLNPYVCPNFQVLETLHSNPGNIIYYSVYKKWNCSRWRWWNELQKWMAVSEEELFCWRVLPIPTQFQTIQSSVFRKNIRKDIPQKWWVYENKDCHQILVDRIYVLAQCNI